MTQTISCPHCRGAVASNSSLAGQVVECPHCSGTFQMPTLSAGLVVTPPPLQKPAELAFPAINTAPRQASFAGKRNFRPKKSLSTWVIWGMLAGVLLLCVAVGLTVQEKKDNVSSAGKNRGDSKQDEVVRTDVGQRIKEIDDFIEEAREASAKDKRALDLTAASLSRRETLGRWQIQDAVVKGEIVLAKHGPLFYALWSFADGSTRNVELVERQATLGRRFDERDSDSDEYYIITAGGSLEVCDPMGVVFTCSNTESPQSVRSDAVQQEAEREQELANERIKQVDAKLKEHFKRGEPIRTRAREILTDIRVPEEAMEEWLELSKRYDQIAERRNNPGGLTLADVQELENCYDRKEEFLNRAAVYLAELNETRRVGYRSMIVGKTTSDSVRKAFPDADITRTVDIDSEPAVIVYEVRWKDAAVVFLRFETKHPRGGLFYLVKKSQVGLE